MELPYSLELEKRIDAVSREWQGVSKKKMFGGVAHLLDGKLAFGVFKDNLILRLGPSAAEKALRESRAKPFDITGRPMKGWVMIGEADVADDELGFLLEEARSFVGSLPGPSSQ
jgi:hypothetical protein